MPGCESFMSHVSQIYTYLSLESISRLVASKSNRRGFGPRGGKLYVTLELLGAQVAARTGD